MLLCSIALNSSRHAQHIACHQTGDGFCFLWRFAVAVETEKHSEHDNNKHSRWCQHCVTKVHALYPSTERFLCVASGKRAANQNPSASYDISNDSHNSNNSDSNSQATQTADPANSVSVCRRHNWRKLVRTDSSATVVISAGTEQL